MIARVGQGPMDLAIILCDGSKGLGSVPAFQKKQMSSGHQGHGDMSHGDMSHSTMPHSTMPHSTMHHGESGGCADCDLTWGSGLLEDVVLASGEIQFEFQSQQLSLTKPHYSYYVQQFYSYDSRAPPILLIT